MADTLYKFLMELDPVQVKQGADPDEARAGLQIYERQDFRHYEWIKPGHHLRAMIQVHRVEFGHKDGAMIAACKCGGSEQERCRHVLAAMFTFCNLVNDTCLTVFFRNNKQHEILHQWFWSAFEEDESESSGPSKLAIQLERNHAVSVQKMGAEKTMPRLYETPAEFSDEFPAQLAACGEDIQIQFTAGSTSAQGLQMDLTPGYVLRVHWDLNSGGKISATPVVNDAEGRHLADAVSYTPFLALREDARELLMIEPGYNTDDPGQGKSLIEMVERGLPRPLSIDAASFNRGQILVHGEDLAAAMQGLVFSRGGEEVEPVVETVALKGVLSKSTMGDDTYYRFKLHASVGEQEDSDLLAWFYEHFVEVILPSRADMRSAKKIATNLSFLDRWFVGGGKRKNVLLADDAPGAQLLNEIVTQLILRLHFRVDIQAGEWRLTEIPVQRAGFAIAAVRQAMEVETLWLDDGIQLRASEAEVSVHMPKLVKVLKNAGVELEVEGQAVRSLSLDVSVDAERGQDRDWFDLHPTVRMHGRTLSGEEWLELIREGGVFWDDDGLAVLDADDLDLLTEMQGLVEEGDPLEEGIVPVPRLEIFKWVELRRRGMTVNFPDDVQEMMAALEHFDQIPSLALPKKLDVNLRPYQQQGYEWLAFLYLHGFGACLADDMGLGKTLQAIALLAARKENLLKVRFRKARPQLVVVPSSLVFNWQQEIAHFYPDLKVLEYLGAGRDEQFEGWDVVITTYGTLARSSDRLKNIAFDIAVFDEAQAIKNIKSERTGAARQISAEFKLCLTGTPVENHIGEYFSIMDLALPGLLGSYGEFSRRDDALELAVNRTKPFILRRTKEAILTELPPKIENEIHLELSPLQKECYTRTVEEVKGEVEAAYSENTSGQASIVALTALLRLRQVCVSPAIHHSDIDELSPKLAFLGDRLQQLDDEGHAALVFSQFTRCLDLIEAHLKEQGLRYLRLDGSVPTKKRKDLVERFQKEDGPAVFLISLKTGGVGLNLTRASYVYHVDPWWNPAAENQASDRAHRMGQKQTVMVTRLVMRHTVEEKIMQLKQEKQAIFDAIVDGTGDPSAGGALSREDFEFLLT